MGEKRKAIVLSCLLGLIGCLPVQEDSLSEDRSLAGDLAGETGEPGGRPPGETPVDPELDDPIFEFFRPQETVSVRSANGATRVEDFSIPHSFSFTKIKLSMEVFNGGWHEGVFGGEEKNTHAVFWFTRGERWGEHVIAYFRIKQNGGGRRLKLGTNLGYNTPLMVADYLTGIGSAFQEEAWSYVELTLETRTPRLQVGVFDLNGTLLSSVSGRSTLGPGQKIQNPFDRYVLAMGSDVGDGPETHTGNWRFRNILAQFFN